MFSLPAVSLAHLFLVSLCTKVLVILCLCLDEFAVILKFELCFKIPFLYPVSLRIRLKSAKLAHRAPVFVPLIVRSGSPGCTQICHRLFRTISSSQNSAFVLYASCLCNMFLFFPTQITILSTCPSPLQPVPTHIQTHSALLPLDENHS